MAKNKYNNVEQFMRQHPELPTELTAFFRVALKYDDTIGFASRHSLIDSLSTTEVREIKDAFDRLADIMANRDIRNFLDTYFDSNNPKYKHTTEGTYTDAYVCASSFVELYSSIIMRRTGEDV